jgi:VWFA-related protein
LISVSKSILKQKGQPPDPVVGRPLYRPADEGPPTGQGADVLDEYFTLLNARREYNLDQAHRAAETLAAFRELAQSFGGIAGKKTVMWLTGDASPLNPSMMYRILIQDKSVETNGVSSWETAKTYEALNSAAVSVFPVDVRGIGNSGMRNAGESQTHEEFEQSVRGTQYFDMSPYSGISDMRDSEAANSVLAMDSVAGETGATVLAGSNRVENLLDRAHKLWANYYVLSFVPDQPGNDKAAAYHRIQVKLDRPGTHVLARRGFLTRPEAMLSSEFEIQRDIAEAVNSPIDLTSLSLQVTLGEPRDEDGLRHLPLTLTISNAVLGTVSERGAPYDLSLAVLVRDQHDRLLTNAGKRIRAFVPSGDVAGIAVKGLKYDSEFQSPVGNFFFGRVIVRDNLSGRTGTISLTLPNTTSGS